MVRPIQIYGSNILRRRTINVTEINDEVRNTIKDLKDTLRETDGIGLASPQIGDSKSIFAINYEGKNFDQTQIFINPQIKKYFGKDTFFNEECLSIPEISGEIIRPSDIQIEYYDEKFEKHTKEYKELMSRVIQHEYDHLLGRLYIDLLPTIQYITITQSLEKIKKGKFKVNYKTNIYDNNQKKKE